MPAGMEHKDLAIRAVPWIRSRSTARGIRCGHEVPIAASYVADTVVLCGMQNQFRKRYAPDSVLEWHGASLILPEFACIFEAKATRSDFLATFGNPESNRFDYLGSLHWVVVPHLNICADTDIEHWGVLVKSGGGLREVVQPRFWRKQIVDISHIAYHLLWYGKDEPG